MTYYAGKDLRTFVDGYELSAYITAAEPVKAFTGVEFAIGYPRKMRAYLPGLENSRLTLEGHWTDTTGKVHDRFADLTGGQVISLFPRGGTAGAAAYGMKVAVIEYPVGLPIDDRITFRAGLPPNTASRLFVGRCLALQEGISASGYGEAVYFGASGTDGGVAVLQIFGVSATDSITVAIEHSTTGAFAGEEATLTTFSLDGSSVGAELKTLTGTINRYCRVVWTVNDVSGNPDFDIAVMLSIKR